MNLSRLSFFFCISSVVPLFAFGPVSNLEHSRGRFRLHAGRVFTPFRGVLESYWFSLELVEGEPAYSGGCRTLIPISVGQRSDLCRTLFRFISDSVPG